MAEDELNIEFLGGPCLMQGWGTIRGDKFYFRARWDYWAFSVSEDPKLDPVDIWDSGHGYYIEEGYGKTPYDAGYMPEEEAEAIIRRCAKEYLTKKHKPLS